MSEPKIRDYLLKLSAFLIFALAFSFAAQAQDEAELPERIDFVSDYVELFEDDVKANLTNALMEVQETAGLEINVLTVQTTAPLEVAEFGYRVLESWGIDESDPDSRYLLFLVAMDEAQYQLITSAGLERFVSDEKLEEIGKDVIIPLIQPEGLDTAIVVGIDAIINAYAQKLAEIEGGREVHRASGARLNLTDILGVILIVGAVALLLLINSLMGS